ncbi:MAG: SDR family NAD(P)-dependent oxidoreductase, partial [Chloroflexi bacterium]|nr:SDR family NAD(P)-dependent oxidoreductase [Chloroflexota bacterium]
MGKLDGKVAIISGAARGQGEAEARLFAREGAAVVLGDVRDDEGEQAAATIADTGGQALYQHLDVTSEEDWAAAVELANTEFGGVHVLVNNAGIGGASTFVEDTSLEDYMHVINVNQVCVFLGMRAAIPSIRESGGGSIVNISSTAGLEGSPTLAAYASSKWAVRGLTKVAAMELAVDGIRVNSVLTGQIDTPMLRGAKIPMDNRGRTVPLSR